MTRIGQERTIAEIIWDNDEHWRRLISRGPDGTPLDRPDVDDLLEWLHSKRAYIDSIEPETGQTPGADPADRWCVHVLYGDCLGDYFTAPTLLAALEAAVRAVAGEGEQ